LWRSWQHGILCNWYSLKVINFTESYLEHILLKASIKNEQVFTDVAHGIVADDGRAVEQDRVLRSWPEVSVGLQNGVQTDFCRQL
jgi:hypothetical protein